MFQKLRKGDFSQPKLGPLTMLALKSGKTSPMMSKVIFGAWVVCCMSFVLSHLLFKQKTWVVFVRKS